MKKENNIKAVILNSFQHLPRTAVSQRQQHSLKTLKQVQGDCIINNHHAFTLIELLVVVLIIGILAAVAVPQYQKAIDKASFVCVMSILKAVTDAQTVAALEQGGYPTGTNQFAFNDLNINIPIKDESCLSSDICSIKCSGKGFGIVLRKDSSWANFYFWAGSLERLVYNKNKSQHWQLQCTSARCIQTAKAFGATACTGGWCW